jgi:sugar phosphate isomerase/epimerase
MKTTSRRNFIKTASLTASIFPLLNWPLHSWASSDKEQSLSVHIFSKHLQFLDLHKAGQKAAEMGFAGIDLTVRPNGHVLPEQVKTVLPKAIENIKKAGSKCELITTNIESINNPIDVDVLTTAAKTGVQFYRTSWFEYPESLSMPEALKQYQKQIKELSILNKELNIVGCYQNHAGTKVGSSFWEVKTIMEEADPLYFGSQYDIRHAMVEGSHSWENGLRLLHPYIKVIVLKDFKWEKIDGKWEIVNTPIGEGMVDFHRYFKLLKQYNLNPPVSLHIEYPIGGAEKGANKLSTDENIVFDAMKKDLASIQRIWKEA